MPRKIQQGKPTENTLPGKVPEFVPPAEPDAPILPEEAPDIIPDEDPFETPPYEIPEPGEGP